jgi:hypothetical protein
MKNQREAALAALKAIRAEIGKAEMLRLQGRKEKKNTPAPEKAETTKEE